eukprot:8711937-Pyramimonas_sp.AAC.1
MMVGRTERAGNSEQQTTLIAQSREPVSSVRVFVITWEIITHRKKGQYQQGKYVQDHVHVGVYNRTNQDQDEESTHFPGRNRASNLAHTTPHKRDAGHGPAHRSREKLAK